MKSLIVLIFFIYMNYSFALPIENFGNYVLNKTETITQIVEDQENNNQSLLSIKKLRVRFRVSAGFEIPWVTKFTIKPEIELHFKKIN